MGKNRTSPEMDSMESVLSRFLVSKEKYKQEIEAGEPIDFGVPDPKAEAFDVEINGELPEEKPVENHLAIPKEIERALSAKYHDIFDYLLDSKKDVRQEWLLYENKKALFDGEIHEKIILPYSKLSMEESYDCPGYDYAATRRRVFLSLCKFIIEINSKNRGLKGKKISPVFTNRAITEVLFASELEKKTYLSTLLKIEPAVLYTKFMTSRFSFFIPSDSNIFYKMFSTDRSPGVNEEGNDDDCFNEKVAYLFLKKFIPGFDEKKNSKHRNYSYPDMLLVLNKLGLSHRKNTAIGLKNFESNLKGLSEVNVGS